MINTFVLIILIGGSIDGGRAIQTIPGFTDLKQCDESAVAIKSQGDPIARLPYSGASAVRAFCVSGPQIKATP